MKTVELVVSRTVRVNLGDYQSVDFFMSLKGEVESGDDLNKERRKLKNAVEAGLAHDIQMHFVRRNKKASLEQITRRYGLYNGKES